MEEYVYEGFGLEVIDLGNEEIAFRAGVVDGNHHIATKHEAIAAARAILKHFNATLESDQ